MSRSHIWSQTLTLLFYLELRLTNPAVWVCHWFLHSSTCWHWSLNNWCTTRLSTEKTNPFYFGLVDSFHPTRAIDRSSGCKDKNPKTLTHQTLARETEQMEEGEAQRIAIYWELFFSLLFNLKMTTRWILKRRWNRQNKEGKDWKKNLVDGTPFFCFFNINHHSLKYRTPIFMFSKWGGNSDWIEFRCCVRRGGSFIVKLWCVSLCFDMFLEA